jgi:predicted enzyme related to lactoylglutathione lyase
MLLRKLLLLSFALLCGVRAAQAAPFDLPALNSPPSSEHHVGKIVWADLVTPSLPAATNFYGGLFGWTFQTIRAGNTDYAVVLNHGQPIGGIVGKPLPGPDKRQSAWLTFIAVANVDAAKRVALAHKAKVLADTANYARRGRQAVLSDHEGAAFAILASSSGDAPDYLAASGEWIWSSLHAKDAGSEAAFYQEVFGYDVYDATGEDGTEHVILSSDDYARASANAFPDAGRRHAHWLNFVRVDDAGAAVTKALTLGGKVLVEPHPDRHGGMVAVIADPAGAPFGVMEWTDSDTKAEPK